MPSKASGEDPYLPFAHGLDAFLEHFMWPGNVLSERATLTHYTSQAGALGILRTGRLFASNARYLNDDQEITYITTALRRCLDAMRRDSDDPRRMAALRHISDRLLSDGDIDFASEKRVYVACFSRAKDMLSQWRGYGGTEGPAYSLAFKHQDLDRLVLVDDDGTEGPERTWLPPTLTRVIYSPTQQTKLLRTLIEPVVPAVSQALEGDELPRAEAFAQMLGTAMVLPASIFKNEGFKEEREWRVIACDLTYATGSAPTFFRPSKYGLVPYKLLAARETDGERHLPLATVMQGPTTYPELAKDSMEQLLKAEGAWKRLVGKPQVHLSKISYRD